MHKGFRCVSYDRRGHGDSGAYAGEWTVDLLADDLAGLLDELDLRDVTLVGHSLGCGEIVRYLSRHGTARVSRAVLVAPQLPLVVKTADNPDGVDEAMLEAVLTALKVMCGNGASTTSRRSSVTTRCHPTWPGPPWTRSRPCPWKPWPRPSGWVPTPTTAPTSRASICPLW